MHKRHHKTFILALFVLMCMWSPLMAQLYAQPSYTDIPDIIREQAYTTHRAGTNDPTGGNLDKIVLNAGAQATLARIDGPGIITHLWFTISPASNDMSYLSTLILRFYWDDQQIPAIEIPFGALFALGHNECVDINSAAVVVMADTNPATITPPGRAAFNFYLPMPFRQKATITVQNTGSYNIQSLYCHIDYRSYNELPDDVYYLHAQYRSLHTVAGELPDGNNTTYENNYSILETAGRGHYVGCVLHVEAHENEPGKWYEGDEIIRVDGESLTTAIKGTGSEDYFNMAWGVRRWFQSPYFGTSFQAWNPGEREMWCYGRFSLYRWHLPDPIPFKQSISVTIEHGHNNDAENQYSSVAFYYLKPIPTPVITIFKEGKNGTLTVGDTDPLVNPLSFQWYVDPTPGVSGDEIRLENGGVYSGVDTRELTLLSATPSVEGSYFCEVSNNNETVTTDTVQVIVGRELYYWPFDGDAVEANGSGFNGTGASVGTTNGIVGGAAEIAGVAPMTFGNVPVSYPGTGQFTISYWVLPDVSHSNRYRPHVMKYGDDGTGIKKNFYIGGAENYVDIHSNLWVNGVSNKIVVENVLSDTEWSHVAMTYDGVGIKVFVNGVVIGAYDDINFQYVDYDVPLVMGRDPANLDRIFYGKIDEMRIFNYGFSDAEVAMLYINIVGGDVCVYPPALDFNNDCQINLEDYAMFVAAWLECGRVPTCIIP